MANKLPPVPEWATTVAQYDMDRPLSGETEWIFLVEVSRMVRVSYLIVGMPGQGIDLDSDAGQHLVEVAADLLASATRIHSVAGEELPDICEATIYNLGGSGFNFLIRFEALTLMDQQPPTGAIN